ncbi:hypothetical protein C9446_17965 [Providencia heimbachae]|nr:hypothetical protein C9446_17965 [Providencia heimbachae]
MIMLAYYVAVLFGFCILFIRRNLKKQSSSDRFYNVKRTSAILFFYFIAIYSGINLTVEKTLSTENTIFHFISIFMLFLFVFFIWRFEAMQRRN